MSKFLFCLLVICLSSLASEAQFNTSLQSTVTYSIDPNDIWGYEAGGSEYALVGLRTGVNIQDVTNPANPIDLGTASGVTSTWRDIKTFGTYAYVSNETGSGIMVIDLSNLPTPLTPADYWNWEPVIGPDTLKTCHNLYVDGSYLFLAGTNLNSGGILYADVATDPANPAYVGSGAATYAHDVFVDGNFMYASEIYQGEMEIYDITNLPVTISQGSVNTPFNFTHNIWTNGNIAFTTDEKANATTAAYDVTDPNNIIYLDEFKPLGSVNTGVIPHNVHVVNNHLVISHYSDGVVIVDATDPENLIEVGNYDTYTGSGTGGNGAWGAYPFLTSGTILVSDRQGGGAGGKLFVISPTYVQAARLEGKITDMSTGNPIPTAMAVIGDPQPNEGLANFSGDYKSGIATAGTINVTFSAPNYISKTLPATLINGVAVTLDAQLELISLPIELTDFRIEKFEEDQVKLFWNAVANHDLFNFVIERSTDGINFEEIDQIIENGIAGVEKPFEYFDRVEQIKKVYYRIKLIDPDRTFKYSMIRSLIFKNNFVDQITIFPNPVNEADFLNITIPKSSDEISVKILNAGGQVVYNGLLLTGEANYIPANKLSKGLNLVVIEGINGIIKSEQIIR